MLVIIIGFSGGEKAKATKRKENYELWKGWTGVVYILKPGNRGGEITPGLVLFFPSEDTQSQIFELRVSPRSFFLCESICNKLCSQLHTSWTLWEISVKLAWRAALPKAPEAPRGPGRKEKHLRPPWLKFGRTHCEDSLWSLHSERDEEICSNLTLTNSKLTSDMSDDASDVPSLLQRDFTGAWSQTGSQWAVAGTWRGSNMLRVFAALAWEQLANHADQHVDVRGSQMYRFTSN